MQQEVQGKPEQIKEYASSPIGWQGFVVSVKVIHSVTAGADFGSIRVRRLYWVVS